MLNAKGEQLKALKSTKLTYDDDDQMSISPIDAVVPSDATKDSDGTYYGDFLDKDKNILCSRIRKLNIAKMTILSKVIHRFNATPIEIPADFSAETEKLILKFIWKFN